MPDLPPEQLAYLGHLYAEDEREHAFRGSSKNDFDAWSTAARAALRDLVGLNRIRESLGDFTPSVTLGEPTDCGGHLRHPGTLEAEPGFDVEFWFLTPKTAGPHPLALFPHGHYADRGLDFAVGIAASEEIARKIAEEDRDVAVQAVRRGFATIAPSTRGFPPACLRDHSGRHGERDCRSHLMHALLGGRTAIGERVWDLERLIDWATARPDIDDSRVLMMGNSGGGVATLYASACDTRVTLAVPSCSFATYVSKGGKIHHCDCNMVPGILKWGGIHDVAGLIAPRPLLIVNGREDGLFPVEEVEEAVAGVRPIYDAAGATDLFRHEWGPAGHRFYGDIMWPFVMEHATD